MNHASHCWAILHTVATPVKFIMVMRVEDDVGPIGALDNSVLMIG